ncbi:glycosyltransferase family 2 protein [Aestuariicoccus sp. MJ-SS9]|uniref:glycosyltransferase family 2 protein n=1 Tax=Aestuariicoccus sp. MJ-SS9 TaxID=3079855 RepID=UPI00291192AA|nr:glycosyltransferase family 2 protein [Aestuariicoccus sp. MJ-SS9]MDU8913706.1 glycosyltransferase family 2 protein [Aestuariicoccus sp. MJ-SS9]
MDLSIVIVNWNTRALLRDCLRSVFDGLGPLVAEVLVADNASDDGSVAMVRRDFPQVRLIENAQNLGFAAGNNVALRQARGRYVMLLNTDTLVHGSVLQEAVAWLDARPDVGIMGPRVLNADGTVQPSCSAFPSLRHLAMQTLGLTRIARWDSYRMTGWDRASERRVDVISGAAMFVRRSAMQEVGLLDEAFFFYGEETDWCHRFARAGWQIVFVPIPEITHFGNGSAGKLNHRRDVLMTQGTTRLHRKHGGRVAGLACFAILAAHNASRAFFWSAMTLLGRSGANARARHFRAVVADLPSAWPATPVGAAQ